MPEWSGWGRSGALMPDDCLHTGTKCDAKKGSGFPLHRE